MFVHDTLSGRSWTGGMQDAACQKSSHQSPPANQGHAHWGWLQVCFECSAVRVQGQKHSCFHWGAVCVRIIAARVQQVSVTTAASWSTGETFSTWNSSNVRVGPWCAAGVSVGQRNEESYLLTEHLPYSRLLHLGGCLPGFRWRWLVGHAGRLSVSLRIRKVNFK